MRLFHNNLRALKSGRREKNGFWTTLQTKKKQQQELRLVPLNVDEDNQLQVDSNWTRRDTVLFSRGIHHSDDFLLMPLVVYLIVS